ncbi:hypothetical protein [Patulibacter americanus]|uniref:hypothetical protein n=1 Tax=Patulibacter americanus TaxID=588672 RepID=UPI0003B47F44|nr:hypothetical protein [Patulibacter americanus]
MHPAAPVDPLLFAAWWRGGAEAELRDVLMRSWDPIGVAGDPAAADEYDPYLLGLVGLLRAGASVADVASRLLEIERSEMGLSTDPADPRRSAVAHRVHAWHAAPSPRRAAGPDAARCDGPGR